MATYNEWMNLKIYEASAKLTREELLKDRGAFFRSILGTLNHLVVADTLWLKRFHSLRNFQSLASILQLKTPTRLNEILFDDLQKLTTHRKFLDSTIKQWSEELTDDDLGQKLRYTNTQGVESLKNFFSIVTHFFNHQTHHRGQVTTLLSQAGQDIGVTDLLALIPHETDLEKF